MRVASAKRKIPEANARGLSTHPALVGDFPQIWRLEENEPEDLKFYTELDNALFEAGLPHLLDILSVTSVVNAVLEADQPAAQIKAYLQTCVERLETLKKPAHQGIPALAGLLVRLMGAIGNQNR